jgi:hypothetical protein
MNLYHPRKKGFYIYATTERDGIRYKATRRHTCGLRRNAIFHSSQEAIDWLNSLVGD